MVGLVYVIHWSVPATIHFILLSDRFVASG